MTQIGKFNILETARKSDFGIYCRDSDGNEILLPNKYVPLNCQIGQKLNLFIYLDSEDRIVATTRTPKAQVGDFAFLEVKDVNNFGAFLDWGLEKDLFLPYREQRQPLRKNNWVVVYIYLDEQTRRISATTKLNKHFYKKVQEITSGDSVSALVFDISDLGYNCIVNNKYNGLLYRNEVFQPIKIGDSLTAVVKNRRPDGKLDLSLNQQPLELKSELAEEIMKKLKLQAGFIPANAKTSAEIIYNLFGVSKNTFKLAVSQLYKERKITISDSGIHLASKK